MRIIKNSLIIICVLVILFLMVGCGYTKEELDLKKQYIKQGKMNALQYVKNKYGFEAKISEATALTKQTSAVPDFFPEFSGDVLVEMRYKNESFEVKITGKNESLDGYDNYQEDLIKSSLIALISKELNLTPTKHDISYGNSTIAVKCLINDYFDGNNLSEILNNYSTNILLYYYNHNLNNYVDSLLFKEKLSETKMNIVNFRSLEDLNSFDKVLKNEYEIPMYAFKIRDAISLNNHDFDYYDFDLKSFDVFNYVVKGGSYININECTTGSVYRFVNSSDYEKVSNSYCISGDYDAVYLYYPLDKINNRDYYDYYNFAKQYYKKGEEKYGASVLNSYVDDKYLYSCVIDNEFKFVILGKVK